MKKGNPRKEQKIESRYGYTLLIQYLAGINGKNLYKELYVYISEVAKLGKIIFQGEQKATEYTLDHLLAFVHSSRGNKGGSLPKTNTQ